MLEDFTLEELEEEIARRKSKKEAVPELNLNPNWYEVIQMCKNWVKQLSEDGREEDDDFPHYLAEQVMKILYGEDFWDWHNDL
jgi:hypothetical protein